MENPNRKICILHILVFSGTLKMHQNIIFHVNLCKEILNAVRSVYGLILACNSYFYIFTVSSVPNCVWFFVDFSSCIISKFVISWCLTLLTHFYLHLILVNLWKNYQSNTIFRIKESYYLIMKYLILRFIKINKHFCSKI